MKESLIREWEENTVRQNSNGHSFVEKRKEKLRTPG